MNINIAKQHGLKEEEYKKIINLIGRKPNINELGMFSVMWSEHCCYKSSKNLISQFPTKNEFVVCGPGENAGIIDFEDDIYITFKIESHNHPTAVEPFQGATTGVGGILRDIFTMGARPIANLNSLRFGNLEDKRNRYLFSNAVAGIAWYGNCVGVPTVGGETWFDDKFTGNPLVNAMTVGVIYDKKIIKSGAKGIGNSLIYVGSRTGRDGMAGAAFASKEITEESNKDRPAVQVGDPFKGKLLIESCLEAFKTNKVIACQDMGAAGLTCSVSEMASNGDVGIKLNLDLIPSTSNDITPYEFLLSESQERMMLVTKPEDSEEIINIFKKWGLPAVKVGEIISDKRIIITHKNEEVVNIPSESLTKNAPCYDLPDTIPEYIKEFQDICIDKIPDIEDILIENKLLELLNTLNICSKNWVYQQFDRQVQNNTILHSDHNTSALIRLRDKTGKPLLKGVSICLDCNSRYTYIDPYKGTCLAILEAARNLAVIGSKPLAITNNLNFANPEKPQMFWQLKEACRAIKDTCSELNIPVTGGNVSLYNESNGEAILPTPVIGMIGKTNNINNTITPDFKYNDDIVLLVGEYNFKIDGSEYLYKYFNKTGKSIPEYNINDEKMIHKFCIECADSNLLNSCTDISIGGLLITISKCCFKNNKGIKLTNKILSLSNRKDESIFGESSGNLIISISPENLKKTKEKLEQLSLNYTIIGKIQDQYIEIENTPVKICLAKAHKAWKSALPTIMKD
ncbi:MAG: phosphoribosylformylglycinamidine synthase subunit PurL [Vampirovibrionia bacterium]